MKITYFGHACFEVDLNGKKLLFDPFISQNPQASGIDISSLKPDYILVSHGHGDHVSDVEDIYKNSQATIVSNFEIVTWFQNKGCENGHPMNHGGSWTFDFGKVKMVNAIHSSSLPDGANGGNPAGFVISEGSNSFYFAGDTALTYDMKLLAEDGKINFAFLPIGDNFTMGIYDAVKAAKMVGTNRVIGMHYNTFPIIEIDEGLAKTTFETAGIDLILLEIGKSLEF